MLIQIKNRFTGKIIFERDADSLKLAVEAAVESGARLYGASLCGANLDGADLGGADLCCADLGGANLDGANLCCANLGGAYLCDANLCCADLGGADLGGANLDGADLGGAYLCGANLGCANLGGADLGGANLDGADLGGADLGVPGETKINWSSHDLVAAILVRAAGDDVNRRKVAGLVLVSRDWCWEQFASLRSDPMWAWAVDELRGWVVYGDDAPAMLRDRQAEAKLGERESEGE